MGYATYAQNARLFCLNVPFHTLSFYGQTPKIFDLEEKTLSKLLLSVF